MQIEIMGGKKIKMTEKKTFETNRETSKSRRNYSVGVIRG